MDTAIAVAARVVTVSDAVVVREMNDASSPLLPLPPAPSTPCRVSATPQPSQPRNLLGFFTKTFEKNFEKQVVIQ